MPACKSIAIALIGLGVLPIVAHASEITETFKWVPVQDGGTAQTASGTLTVTLPSFTQLSDSFPPGGTYYTSPVYANSSTAAAALTSLTFDFSNGMDVSWGTATPNATLNSAAISASNTPAGSQLVWATDDEKNTPQVLAGQSAAPSGEYYLITGFLLSFQTTSGATVYFDAANSSGSVYSPGPQESNNQITGGINDDGFWELQPASPVPLPGALPMLIGGLGLLGTAGTTLRRRRTAAV